MRALVFRKLLDKLEQKTPGYLASAEIQILLDTTARAFGVKGKRVWHRPPKRALREYAEFTASCMSRGSADPARLYEESFRTGSMVRRITGFCSPGDIADLVFYLYGNIGIGMNGSIPGEVSVRNCYFSRYYSPEQCAVMSSVDSGMIAGIAGGGKLEFTERITEGSSMCRACFEKETKKGERQ